MATGSYWDRFTQHRMTRRRVLAASAAAGAGAAALALVGCGGDGGDGNGGGGKTPGATGTTNPEIREQAAVGSRGGILRNFSFDALALDTMDPHQTQFGPMYNMHSVVFSRVLQYDDEINGVIGPDLADGMPEQVDDLTYVVKIRRGAKFHDSAAARANFPNTAGREVTAEDVQYSMERQINDASPQKALYYRAGHWKSIEKIEKVDDYTLRITTKSPTAPFLHFLADRNAHIIPKEIVGADDSLNDPKYMVGSGPFMLEEFKAIEVVKARRNPAWFAADDNPNGIGTGRPFMDGYDALWTPQSDSTQESALLAKQVDQTGFADDSNLVRVGGDASKFHLMETGTAGWLNSRLWMSEKSPFKDDRLRHALHLGVDRKLLGEQMFPAGEGRRGFLAQGPVGWIIQRWALPQAELEKKPGYRTDQAGRAEDIAEAKKLWSAAGGPSSLDIVFAGVPAYIPQKALPEMKRQLREVFNVDGKDEVDPTGYTKLGQCFLNNARDGSEGTCMMSWGFDNGWIDLDDWVYPYFHTGGTKNSSLLSDSKLDEMLDKQRGEFDYEKRHQIGLDIQNYLLDSVWARIDYVAPVGRSLSWNYVRNDFTATWFGHNYFYANVWLDQSDAGWSGRPS